MQAYDTGTEIYCVEESKLPQITNESLMLSVAPSKMPVISESTHFLNQRKGPGPLEVKPPLLLGQAINISGAVKAIRAALKGVTTLQLQAGKTQFNYDCTCGKSVTADFLVH